VQEVAAALGLENVKAEQRRVEELQQPYDFVVSRAVAQWTDLYLWTWKLLKKKGQNGMPNGWLLLKGGDLAEEFRQVKKGLEIYPLSDYFKEEFFETKKLVYVQA
jgi:16S rRNA (guanine527-N7)-methyltransferase